MKANRKPEVPVDDYTLDNAVDITFHDLSLSIMPRYQEHFVAHEYERFSIAIVDTYLKKGMKVIDIGAHMGAFSVIMSRRLAKNGLYSYEPVPENRELLKKNLRNNRFSDKQVRPYAISDKDGSASFNIPWASDSAGLYEHPNAETIKTLEVELRSLDSLHAKEKIDFIKIDTEGNEVRVFHGAKELFQRNPNIRLLVEFNPECLESAGIKDPSEFFEVLHGYGFRTLIVHEEEYYFDEVKDPRQWAEAMKGREYANVYCVSGTTKIATVGFHTAQFGGGEMVAQEGCVALEKEGWITTCILPGEGPMADRLRKEGRAVSITSYLPWCHESPIAKKDLANQDRVNAEAVMDIYRTLNRVDVAVSITHTITQPWLALASASNGVPHIWNMHEFGTKGIKYIFDYPLDAIFRIISDLSSRVIVHSRAMEAHMIEQGVAKEKLAYCPIGIVSLSDLVKKKKYPSVAKRFLMLGKITEHKNQLQAVRAVKKALNDGLDIELTLVGSSDETYEEQIKGYVTDNHLTEKVKIIPHTENVREIIIQHDALIMATEYEPFGRVTVEAIAAGIPVVGSKYGGTSEIVRANKDGVLYDPFDSASLYEAIKKLATDKKFYGSLIKNIVTSPIFDQYTVDNFTKEFTSIVKLVQSQVQGNVYFYDKIIPALSNIKRDDDEKIRERDRKINRLEAELDAKHNDLLVANHRVEQLRSRLINKSALKFWYKKLLNIRTRR